MTPPGIDPGTVRLVAQRLNHYATPGSTYFLKQTSLVYTTFVRRTPYTQFVSAGPHVPLPKPSNR